MRPTNSASLISFPPSGHDTSRSASSTSLMSAAPPGPRLREGTRGGADRSARGKGGAGHQPDERSPPRPLSQGGYKRGCQWECGGKWRGRSTRH
eukprot:6515318-Pyramimonas_sp.AAC.1